MSEHLIRRVTILGTGLIGGSFALALRKGLTDISISGWDRPEVVREKEVRNAFDETFSGSLGPALAKADLIYVALPIGVTLDLFSDIARLAPPSALVTDACSTKLRIMEEAGQLFGGNIGGALAPMLTPLIASRFGWAGGLYFACGLVLLGMLAWFFIDASHVVEEQPAETAR